MEQIKLKDTVKGEFIKRSETANKVYLRGEYVRGTGYNKFSCTDTEDMNREIFLKGNAIVFIGFTY